MNQPNLQNIEIDEFSPVFNKKRRRRRSIKRQNLAVCTFDNDTTFVDFLPKEEVVSIYSPTQKKKIKYIIETIDTQSSEDFDYFQKEKIDDEDSNQSQEEKRRQYPELSTIVDVETESQTEDMFSIKTGEFPSTSDGKDETCSEDSNFSIIRLGQLREPSFVFAAENRTCQMSIPVSQDSPIIRRRNRKLCVYMKSEDLLENVLRVLDKSKSDVALWHHSNALQTLAPAMHDGALRFRVLRWKFEFSRYLCVCKEEASKASATTQSPLKVLVLFDSSTFTSQQIFVDSVLAIFPPYQKLISEKFCCPVFISPRFFVVINDDDDSSSSSVSM